MYKSFCLLATIGLCSTATTAFADNMKNISMPMATSATNSAQVVMPMAQTQHQRWSFGYDYSFTHFNQLRDNTDHLSSGDALTRGYMTVPTSMDMQMHMFSAMYHPTHALMLMGMIPYNINDMDETDGMGIKSSMHSEGWGDTKFTGQYNIFRNRRATVDVTSGVSLPTGDDDVRATMMGMPNQKLPYNMQLGSGTYDPTLGLAYSRAFGHAWHWGAKGDTTLRFGRNDQGYRLGNQYNVSLWASRGLGRYFEAVGRLDGSRIDNIHGRDADLDPMADPTNDPKLQAGEQVNAVLGINLTNPNGRLAGSALTAEVGVPVYQNLDGPQLAEAYRFNLGAKLAF